MTVYGRQLAVTPSGSGWRERAACRDAPDPEVFYPGSGNDRPIPERARRAAASFCARCPVLAACGAEADANRHTGLWGGAWRNTKGGSGGYRVVPLVGKGVA